MGFESTTNYIVKPHNIFLVILYPKTSDMLFKKYSKVKIRHIRTDMMVCSGEDMSEAQAELVHPQPFEKSS